MKIIFTTLLAASIFINSISAKTNTPKRKFLVSGSHFDRIAIINQDGKELWTYPEKEEVNDSWYIRNSKKQINYIVMSFKKGIRAVKVNLNKNAQDDRKILWQYKTPKNCEVSSCQALKKNKFLLGISGDKESFIGIFTPPNKFKKIFTVPKKLNGGKHYTFRQVRIDKNNCLYYGIFKQHSAYISNLKNKKTVSYKLKKLHYTPFTVVPSYENDKQYAYIGGGEDSCIIKINSNGKQIWKLDNNNLKNGKLAFVTGINVLKNGNLLVANWGQMIHNGVDTLIEINPKTKKVVWRLPKTKYKNAITSVQLISENGKQITDTVK